MLPEELLKEMSKWIQSYPIVEGSIEYANYIFINSMRRQLRKMSKKYKVPISKLYEYYHMQISKK